MVLVLPKDHPSTCPPFSFLVCHQSDFLLAQKENLIPPSTQFSQGEFEDFIRCFRTRIEEAVSHCEFGWVRLTRLNGLSGSFYPMFPKAGDLTRASLPRAVLA